MLKSTVFKLIKQRNRKIRRTSTGQVETGKVDLDLPHKKKKRMALHPFLNLTKPNLYEKNLNYTTLLVCMEQRYSTPALRAEN